MKEQSRLRILFVLLFSTIVIVLGLAAVIVAMQMSINQWKRENKQLRDKVWVLQTEVDSLKPVYTDKQKIILANVVGNPQIGQLVKSKPVLGGNWGVWSEKSVKFITDDRLLIVFDDGHMMGAVVVRASNPQNFKTWKVLWSTVF